MKLRPFLYALAVLVPCAAYAQQAPEQGTPQVQALANRLTAEINNNLTCSANVITLQEQVKKLSAELAEAKKEPAHDANGTPAKKKP